MLERKRSSQETNSPKDKDVPKAMKRFGEYSSLISSKEEGQRGSTNYHLVGLLDVVDALYTKCNTPLYEDEYGSKYVLGDAQVSIIGGVEKVRRMNNVNRKRKLTRYKSGIRKLYE